MNYARIRAKSAKRETIQNLVNSIVTAKQADEEHVYLHEIDAAMEEALTK